MAESTLHKVRQNLLEYGVFVLSLKEEVKKEKSV
jgi:hypothetical protein